MTAATAPIVAGNGAPAPIIQRPLTVQSFGATDRGKVRSSNEDQFVVATLMRALWIQQSSMPQANVQYADDRAQAYVVADGVGGANGGERASALAVSAIEGFLLNALRWVLTLDGAEDASALHNFQAAVRRADACVCGAAASDPALRGMGTTLTMGYSIGSDLFVAHVGDSRCYLKRAGALHQLTRDDTLVQELVEQGVVSPSDALNHGLRHMITNVVGGTTPGVRTEVHHLIVEPGDQLLLCTDGLTGMLSDARIQQVLEAASNPEQACRELIRLANDEGGTDNVTVAVASYS